MNLPDSPDQIRRIALTQRLLMQIVLAEIGIVIFALALDVAALSFPEQSLEEIVSIVTLASVAAGLAQFGVIFSLGRRLGHRYAVYAYVWFGLLGLLGLPVVLILNSLATRRLKRAGLPVGFLGVRLADLKRYTETLVDRHCPTCGESIAGDAKSCPMCGAAV